MNCIFCDIIDNKIPSHTIYENKYVKAIMDIFPKSNGHVLVLLKKHYSELKDVDETSMLELMKAVQYLYPIIKDVMQCDGLHILENYGCVQEIPHVHFHIIPTYINNPVVNYNKIKEPIEIELLAQNIKTKLN